jgi:hypothetical protein
VKVARRMAKQEYPRPTAVALVVFVVVGDVAVAEFWDGGEVGPAVAGIEMAEVATEVGLNGEYDRVGL